MTDDTPETVLLDSKGRAIDDSPHVLTPAQMALGQLDNLLCTLYERAEKLIEAGAMPVSARFRDVSLDATNRAIAKVAKLLIEIALEMDSTPPKGFADAAERALSGVKRMREALEHIAASECAICGNMAIDGLTSQPTSKDQLPLPTPLG